jgi:hypothetical protein
VRQKQLKETDGKIAKFKIMMPVVGSRDNHVFKNSQNESVTKRFISAQIMKQMITIKRIFIKNLKHERNFL